MHLFGVVAASTPISLVGESPGRIGTVRLGPCQARHHRNCCHLPCSLRGFCYPALTMPNWCPTRPTCRPGGVALPTPLPYLYAWMSHPVVGRAGEPRTGWRRAPQFRCTSHELTPYGGNNPCGRHRDMCRMSI